MRVLLRILRNIDGEDSFYSGIDKTHFEEYCTNEYGDQFKPALASYESYFQLYKYTMRTLTQRVIGELDMSNKSRKTNIVSGYILTIAKANADIIAIMSSKMVFTMAMKKTADTSPKFHRN